MKRVGTSLDAYEAISQSKGELYRLILSFVEEQNGATCEEIETSLGLKHQTASARCSELLDSGDLVRDGKRKTSSGRQAHILKRASVTAPNLSTRQSKTQQIKQLQDTIERVSVAARANDLKKVKAILGISSDSYRAPLMRPTHFFDDDTF